MKGEVGHNRLKKVAVFLREIGGVWVCISQVAGVLWQKVHMPLATLQGYV